MLYPSDEWNQMYNHSSVMDLFAFRLIFLDYSLNIFFYTPRQNDGATGHSKVNYRLPPY